MDNKGYVEESGQSYKRRGSTSFTNPPSYDEVEGKSTGEAAISMPKFSRFDSTTSEQNQITFSWNHISVSAPVASSGGKGFLGFGKKKGQGPGKKAILKDVSGYCKPGELLAIMGASGAGKSTLLNALTYRNLTGLKIEGGARYANGIPVSPNSLTAVSAYVQQDDLFIGTLTVREHLNFQALVRMDKDIPVKDRMERVESVLQELGLKKCEKTMIGIQGRIKGISGGEMKRLAFASEVLTNPPLMFCDEPTSGLDSYMAQNVVEVLKGLASRGKTIVCTIHQPSSQVYDMFDRVLLMAEGRVAFLGDTSKATTFFSEIGMPCPMNYNPADHYIHMLAVTPGKEEACRELITKTCDTFHDSADGQQVTREIEFQLEHAANDLGEQLKRAEKVKSNPYKASTWTQFKALMWRSWLSVIKEPMIMQVRFAQTIIISLVLGIIYFGQDEDSSAVMNINGALFLLLTNTTFQNMFAVVNVFCMELPIFLREHFNGMYRTDIYFLCKQLAEFPLFLITPIIFVAIFYYMVGMNPAFERFAMCCLVILLVTQVVVGFGYFISCIAPNLNIALALAPPLIIPVMLFGGFFLNSQSVPDWLVWLKYLSWFLYSNELLVINQWDGFEFEPCDNFTLPCYPDGETVYKSLGFSKDNIAFDYGMLVALAVGFRLLGLIALLAKTYRKSK